MRCLGIHYTASPPTPTPYIMPTYTNDTTRFQLVRDAALLISSHDTSAEAIEALTNVEGIQVASLTIIHAVAPGDTITWDPQRA